MKEKNASEKVKVTVMLPRALWADLRSMAVRQGLPAGELMTEMLTSDLAKGGTPVVLDRIRRRAEEKKGGKR